ncbi:MAG: GAF domain-containing sensor histidine kinase [Candidatus Dormibacteraeota bacterium]|nr:GAF domain-containing sensor histidine kinase [Candidatus Dormibacteraeota bacterium]
MCALRVATEVPGPPRPDDESLMAAAMSLLAITDPRELRSRLVRLGLEQTGADRCTLTSIDQGVLRVEDSFEWGRRPRFIGKEYSLSHLQTQPLLQQAISTARVVTGGGFGRQGELGPELADSLPLIKRTAVVPLKLGADIGALLILSRKKDQPFRPSDLARLYGIGNLAVLALHNARLREGVNAAQRRGLDALTLISEHVAAIDRLPDFFGRMTATVAGLAGAGAAAYWVVHGDRISAQQDAYGFTPLQLAGMSVSMATAMGSGLRSLLYGGEALRYQRGKGGDSPPWCPIALPETQNLLAVPWRTSEGPLGMLVAYDSTSGFAEQDEWIMRLSARSSALVWQSHVAQRRVSELQATELDRLQRHSERMAALERQKSDFLKLASHELRGPIAIVRGYLSMMLDGSLGDLRPTVGETAAKMESQMLRIKQLVDQMLAAARLQESEMPTNVAETRIDEVVRDVVASVAATVPESRRLIVEADRPVTALADRGHVETIVGNLLSNALKYSPGGGDIVVTVRECPTDVELDVRDHGIGIPATNRAHLFEPFTRGEEAEMRAIDGAGLGLYLSRQLARAQGGDVTVRSELGKGSVFTLRLPRRRA